MSKKVLIIGANGKIGRILSKKMSGDEAFEPTAMIRDEGQKGYFSSIKVDTVLQNLEDDAEEFADLFQNYDVIVFTAGSGGKTGFDKTLEIDLDGAVKCIEAAEKANIERFVMVSAIHADSRDAWDKSGIKPYYIAKHYADRILKASSLKYTILRPGRLLDEKGTGKIAASTIGAELKIPREDVANVIVDVLKKDNTKRKVIDLASGEVLIIDAL